MPQPTHTETPTVFLFDIDGTLITTGGVGRRAMARAFLEVLGAAESVHLPFDGMTDQQIVRRELAHARRVAEAAGLAAAVFERYLVYLTEEVTRASASDYRVHPGVERALELLAERGVALGLGTGNVREGARIKLERVGLYAHFAFGGFGCDAHERADLLRHGAERGARALGVTLDECRVLVIGDTPRDVSAARAIGARCLGVGTGAYSPDELLSAGASWAFSTLADPGALSVLLGPAM